MTPKKYIVVFFLLGVLNAIAQINATNMQDFELKLNNKQTTSLAELKGKVVLFDFWHRSCYPCLKAIPDLIKIQEEFKNDLVIIGINDFDNDEDITAYFKFKGVNYLSTYKTERSISKRINVKLFPTTLLFDKNGTLIYTDTGYSISGMRKLKNAIKKAVK